MCSPTTSNTKNFEKARNKLNLQKTIENLRSSESKKNLSQNKNGGFLPHEYSPIGIPKKKGGNKFSLMKSKVVDEENEVISVNDDTPLDKSNSIRAPFDFGDIEGSIKHDSFAADFQNLEKYDSERSRGFEQSLNLGSAYSNNEYQFDDKVSSVQRDLSLDNCTDEYNSILNSSDVSKSEQKDQVNDFNSKRQGGGLSKAKSKARLGGLGAHSMARVKSSAKLFTVDTHAEPEDDDEKDLGGALVKKEINQDSYISESVSDLSTGDSAYPVISFKSRAVKEFEPKVSINSMNRKQKSMVNIMSRVPTHTKLTYEAPLKAKEVQSPPYQSSFEL